LKALFCSALWRWISINHITRGICHDCDELRSAGCFCGVAAMIFLFASGGSNVKIEIMQGNYRCCAEGLPVRGNF
jgi:hypothetical protein